MGKSTHSFNAQTFLDSAGLSKKITEYARDEVIFSQGDRAESVMYIQKGGVKLSVLSKTGREAVVAMLGPSDFFGEGCLAGQPIRIGSATAITPSNVLVIEKNQMEKVLHEQHALSDRFIAHMLSRNARVEQDLIDQLFNSSEKRLARAPVAAGALWPARRAAAAGAEDFSGDPVGNGRDDAIACELFHEQVQAIGVHRVQR